MNTLFHPTRFFCSFQIIIKELFHPDSPVFLCSLITKKMPFTFDRYQAFLAGQRPEMKKLLESTYAGQQFAKDEAFSQYVWDVLAAAILIDPSLITEERTCAVDVSAEFGPSYGQALAYPDNGPQGSQKARIVMTIDQERFWNMLTAR